MSYPWSQLEDGVGQLDYEAAPVLSQAISLKRIADALEKQTALMTAPIYCGPAAEGGAPEVDRKMEPHADAWRGGVLK